jgi:geranylgeranyl pyrophosphate synthase
VKGSYTLKDLENDRNRLWPAIADAIAETVSRDTSNGSLEQMTWYHMETGGKRLRGIIPITIYEALGGETDDAIALGAAVEMLHNATLVHDDVQDGDTHRRGQETVWKKYTVAQAINCGDGMFYYALELLHALKASDNTRLRLCSLLQRSTIKVIHGQVEEFHLKAGNRPLTLDSYLDVVRGKTSGLFGLPLAGAAMLRERHDLVDTLQSIGTHLGVIFQIQDDLLDLVGQKGRAVDCSDIAEGKWSWMAIHCHQNSSTEDAALLKAILEKPREETSSEDTATAIRLMKQTRSLEAAAQTIGSERAHVEQLANKIESPEATRILDGLCEVFLAPIADFLEKARTNA